jgi:hypothetical protein
VVSEYTQPAQAHWKEMYKKYHLEHENIDPVVALIANDNWLEFTLRYIVDYKKRRIIKDNLFEEIISKIERTDGKVAIASSTLQLVDLPVVKLDIPNRSVQP